jgi:SDR family mycofactocin-dependent oxidoreductase
MPGRVEGKVAFVTGAARGQGRSHAVSLAREGADIIAIDIAAQIDTVPFPMAGPDDLKETVRQVEALDRRIIAVQADVRDFDAVKQALELGVAKLGRLDIVVANAAIANFGRADQMSEDQWRDVIDVDLTGVWHTAKAAVPHIRAGGRGGSIVLISSAIALGAGRNVVTYTAAKHGVIGLMRTLALELGGESIRVNSIHPGNCNTDMLHNEALYALYAPDLPVSERTLEAIRPRMLTSNALPTPWVEPEDISNAVLFLAADDGRFITGVTLPVDAGHLLLGR